MPVLETGMHKILCSPYVQKDTEVLSIPVSRTNLATSLFATRSNLDIPAYPKRSSEHALDFIVNTFFANRAGKPWSAYLAD